MRRWIYPALLSSLMAFAGAGPDAHSLPQPAQEKQPPPTTEKTPNAQAEVPFALPKGKKLVLKDGSFQLVRSYERIGDRVRFYSVERSAWEEMPADRVDWDATRKAEAEDARRRQESVEKMRALEATERAAEVDVDASIEIAPGVFLPEGEGLYLVEGRVAVPLTQVSAEAKLDKGRLLTQVLVPIPVIPSRHKVQIVGKRAALRIAAGQPEFYVRTADAREPEIELIRAELKGNVREIEWIDTVITGQQYAKRKSLAIERWKVARSVYRLTVSQQLEPGEYVLAEILPDKGMNLFVWDFGMDAASSAPRDSTPPKKTEKK